MNHIDLIERSLSENTRCSTGVLCNKRAFVIDAGPSGGPELLALLFADEKHLGYWYGHVRLKTSGHNGFAAMLAWLNVYVNAPTVPLLFARFDYWVRIRNEYEPCAVQNDGDAYAEADTFSEGVQALASMIALFDIKKRYPDELSTQHADRSEYRVLDIYGLSSYSGQNDPLPGPPMLQPLKIVKAR